MFFFFNDTATTEIYTLSLHDALPISGAGHGFRVGARAFGLASAGIHRWITVQDRKSTRLNSSHLVISYAVFCLKKKKTARPAVEHGPSRHGLRPSSSRLLASSSPRHT